MSTFKPVTVQCGSTEITGVVLIEATIEYGNSGLHIDLTLHKEDGSQEMYLCNYLNINNNMLLAGHTSDVTLISAILAKKMV